MKTVASLMILFSCLVFPLAAQTDESEEDDIPRSVNEATMIGVGGYNVMDTDLTPGIETKYTGWGLRILNERMKVVRLANYNVSRQQFLNVEFASTRNAADVATDYIGFVDYSLGYHYRFTNIVPNLKVLAGASARLSGGFIYNTRNSNNPASGKADLDLNFSAMVIYGFKIRNYPITFRYQMEIPFIGALFAIHKGQPYYYLSQGDRGGVIKFSSLHNKFAMRNYFTFDFPVANFTVRAGYLNSMYRTDVNGVKTHVLSNSFMIGLVKEFVSFGGKRLKKTHEYSSAYY